MSGENRAKARRQQPKSKQSGGASGSMNAPPKVRSGSGGGGTATPTSAPRGPASSGGRSTNGVAWLVGGVVVAIAVVIILVVTLTGGDDTAGNAKRGAVAAAQGLHQTQPVTITGTPLSPLQDTQDDGGHAVAPTLTGHTFDGTASVAPVKGKPTMIVFGAHWCPHCQKEFPEIVDWMAKGGNKDATVIAVPTGTNAQAPNYPPRRGWIASVGRARSSSTTRTARPPRPTAWPRIRWSCSWMRTGRSRCGPRARSTPPCSTRASTASPARDPVSSGSGQDDRVTSVTGLVMVPSRSIASLIGAIVPGRVPPPAGGGSFGKNRKWPSL